LVLGDAAWFVAWILFLLRLRGRLHERSARVIVIGADVLLVVLGVLMILQSGQDLLR
jgi:ABC-type nickel/cobalt efflux system permease component RcnA